MRRLWLVPAAVLVFASGPSPARSDAPDVGTVVVTLGDGVTMPLRNWSLSYEYALWTQGTSPLTAPTARKEAAEVLVGKRSLPAAGRTLTFTYREVPRALVAAGTAAESDRFKSPREVVLTGPDGKKESYKVEPPHRDLLDRDPPKGTTVLPRTLDLRGETVTGTRKDFCLLSYTATIECGGSPANAVVKIQFQP
ncbi:MAG TPA: hypothetical protein VMR21_07610 [Vicinamibacteria bacterium]|nr:hypothetical protein [Vicinamibacteria bacterium]